MLRIEFAGDTHVGQKRDTNQDALLLLPEEDLFVVADGMGGHLSGEVASSLARLSLVPCHGRSASRSYQRWQTGPEGEPQPILLTGTDSSLQSGLRLMRPPGVVVEHLSGGTGGTVNGRVVRNAGGNEVRPRLADDVPGGAAIFVNA